MKKKMIALCSALAIMLTFFTACGNGGTTTKPPATEGEKAPQLVVALNPIVVYSDDTASVAYNDFNTAMGKDSQTATLSGIADADWTWANRGEDGWNESAVHGFNYWMNGAGTTAKGVFAYNYNAAGSNSLGVYNLKSANLKTYGDEELPASGMLLSAIAGEEGGLHYTIKQDDTVTIPAGTITAIDQVAGIKTGFLAEDGTARSASVCIMLNNLQLYSGTLCNSTAAEDGVAVTQISYPQIEDVPVKQGQSLLIVIKLNAQANSDDDITIPSETVGGYWQVVEASRTVVDDSGEGDKQVSNVVTDDGSIMTITNYQFTFTLVRDAKYVKRSTEFAETIMRRTGAEVVTGREGKSTDYEIVLGVTKERPESQKIYNEIVGARADNATDYIIRLVGTKLYIVGANDEALQLAMDYFLETFVKDDKGKIPAKYNYYNKPAHVMYTLAGQNIASYTIRTERYPSLIVQRAAEAIQNAVRAECGYVIPIKAMNLTGADVGTNEIRVGPMNGAVKVDREYDTRFNSSNWQTMVHSIGSDGMMAGADGDYAVAFNGKNVEIRGGESYSVSVATMKFLADLKKSKNLATTYAMSGNYVSYFDYQNMYEYDKVDFSMADGYGLSYSEDFNYTGTDKEKESAFTKHWTIQKEVSDSSRQDGDQMMYQVRPGIYGRNYWVAADTAGNNYLFEVTMKRTMEQEGTDLGYESVRVAADGQWGFRYGIWETRLVMGTRNGNCSSVWGSAGAPYVGGRGATHEIDVYENYGRECFVPCTHHTLDGKYLGNYHFQYPYYQEPCWVEPNEGEHFYDTFHHVAIEWNYDKIEFYFDGECVSRMPMFNQEDFKYYRTGMVIRLAQGVGARGYCWTHPRDFVGEKKAYHVNYWMEDVSKFFELQLVDYTRVYQTDNDNIEYEQAHNEIKFMYGFGE